MYGTNVSVIGDFRCNPMADFLERELGFEIEVKSCFEEDRSSFEPNLPKSSGAQVKRLKYFPLFFCHFGD
ncbi:MAG: hypothetical protein STSR0001_20190 [Methanothrix sp.]